MFGFKSRKPLARPAYDAELFDAIEAGRIDVSGIANEDVADWYFAVKAGRIAL